MADKQTTLLGEETGHFSLIRAMHMADLITELNGFCGVMSVFSSMRYMLGEPTELGNIWFALAFMPFGLFFDFLDGKVARWRQKSSLMGQELDSLADLVCSTAFSHYMTIFASGTDFSTRKDLLRCLPSNCRLRHRFPHSRRPCYPRLLRPLRPHSPGPLQCNRGKRAQRRDGQVTVLRRHADPHDAVYCWPDGILGVARLGVGQLTTGNVVGRHALGIPPCSGLVCAQRVPDDE